MTVRGWLALLAALGALERAALRLVYSPVQFGDTPSYLRLANALGEAGLAGYDATRVPGYPWFLLALDGDPQRVWLAQLALGWGISLLLFWIGWRTTGSARFGFGLGMLYNLIPGLVLFEANLLSETLTAFCVVLSLALLVWLQEGAAPGEIVSAGNPARPGATAINAAGSRPSRASAWGGRRESLRLLALGTASGAAGLVRALFYPLAPWLALFVARPPDGRWSRLARFAAMPLLLLGGWVGIVYRQYEVLSPTTMGGYHLVQHSGEYFELLPDQHAVIRDTYLKYRDARVAERGVQTNAIWDAIPELTEVTGLSFFALSAEMQRLSVQLILAHPGRYLANVVQGWIDFWKAPAIWQPAALQFEGLVPLFRAWALVGRGISLAANAAFLALSAVAAMAFSLSRLGGLRQPTTSGNAFLPRDAHARRGGPSGASHHVLRRLGADTVFWAFAGLVWMTSIVQTLVDHGDNPRFLVPLQMVVIFVVLRSGWCWISGRKGVS